ncbi:MAG: VTT domain-containing protein [Ferruginibacter sp.]|nr:VTT domain-containing protein [Chitinophagaceae bacterium]
MIKFNSTNILNHVFLFIDGESLIRYGGLLIVFLVVYGSTGLFFCFFLPTGAVLFTAGVLTAAGDLEYSVFTVCALLIFASVLGNLTGYWLGWKAGPLLYNRKDSKYFRKQYLKTAASFYQKYGWLALTLGLYLPIIRTFAPIVAGIVKLHFRRLVLLTVAGSALWISSFVLAGYFIGSRPFLKPWLKYIVAGFILLVTIPLLIKLIKEIRKLRRENQDKNTLR